jgi:hypothetical protein
MERDLPFGAKGKHGLEDEDEGSGHVLTNQHAASTERAGEWEGKGVTIWEGEVRSVEGVDQSDCGVYEVSGGSRGG